MKLKRRDLIPGTEYAVVNRSSSYRGRDGIPTCSQMVYMGENIPGLRTAKRNVWMVPPYHRKEVRALAVPMSDVFATWDKYLDITDEYDKEESAREKVNSERMAYLVEHFNTMYGYDEVYFNATTGQFEVSAKIFIELHGLSAPEVVRLEKKQ